MRMRLSDKGLDLIKKHEDLRLTSYLCPAGKWTIGYGHTRGVTSGMSINEAEAELFLKDDVREAEDAVNRYVKVPLTQGQFDALVSFVFNLGVGNLLRSTLLRMINLRRYRRAATEFLRWVYGGGKKLGGLIRRRKHEKNLFES